MSTVQYRLPLIQRTLYLDVFLRLTTHSTARLTPLSTSTRLVMCGTRPTLSLCQMMWGMICQCACICTLTHHTVVPTPEPKSKRVSGLKSGHLRAICRPTPHIVCTSRHTHSSSLIHCLCVHTVIHTHMHTHARMHKHTHTHPVPLIPSNPTSFRTLYVAA